VPKPAVILVGLDVRVHRQPVVRLGALVFCHQAAG
jgi:hypothetical protein